MYPLSSVSVSFKDWSKGRSPARSRSRSFNLRNEMNKHVLKSTCPGIAPESDSSVRLNRDQMRLAKRRTALWVNINASVYTISHAVRTSGEPTEDPLKSEFLASFRCNCWTLNVTLPHNCSDYLIYLPTHDDRRRLEKPEFFCDWVPE